MTDEKIIETYKDRKMTIREMAKASDRSYNDVRMVIVRAGYHNGNRVIT